MGTTEITENRVPEIGQRCLKSPEFG